MMLNSLEHNASGGTNDLPAQVASSEGFAAVKNQDSGSKQVMAATFHNFGGLQPVSMM